MTLTFKLLANLFPVGHSKPSIPWIILNCWTKIPLNRRLLSDLKFSSLFLSSLNMCLNAEIVFVVLFCIFSNFCPTGCLTVDYALSVTTAIYPTDYYLNWLHLQTNIQASVHLPLKLQTLWLK